jgi:hypothetical protein
MAKQHPTVKAYIKAFCANGGKAWKGKFNPYSLDQVMLFGYRKMLFRIYSVGTVPSWSQALIPQEANNRLDIVMIPSPDFGDWLACDEQAKKDYEAFMQVVGKTFASGE